MTGTATANPSTTAPADVVWDAISRRAVHVRRQHHRQLEVSGSLEQARDLLAYDRAHAATHEAEHEGTESDCAVVDAGAADLDGFVDAGLVLRGADPFFVGFATVFFRATSIDSAFLIFGRIFTWAPGTEVNSAAWGMGLIALYALHWANRAWLPEGLLARLSWPMRLVVIGAMVAVLYLFAGSGAPFYYFQF